MARIPIAPVGRIIKESGAERVSEDAKVALEGSIQRINQIGSSCKT